ncbi:helix-turn-helix domain-containing protein [uncultured Sneathia sp.]|uniref:helix-turn-helix domain-containing protein n=1 Tax=uncultured Sneathia sp. TaxID=278067 RepID=UPI0025934632|nr:helix-turn-helix domain-containing protein [uncultured Sneathia sp.]
MKDDQEKKRNKYSFDQLPFFLIKALKNKEITCVDIVVFCELLNKFKTTKLEETKIGKPIIISQQKIAEEYNLSRPTINKTIKNLVKLGYLISQRRYNKSTIYYLGEEPKNFLAYYEKKVKATENNIKSFCDVEEEEDEFPF